MPCPPRLDTSFDFRCKSTFFASCFPLLEFCVQLWWLGPGGGAGFRPGHSFMSAPLNQRPVIDGRRDPLDLSGCAIVQAAKNAARAKEWLSCQTVGGRGGRLAGRRWTTDDTYRSPHCPPPSMTGPPPSPGFLSAHCLCGPPPGRGGGPGSAPQHHPGHPAAVRAVRGGQGTPADPRPRPVPGSQCFEQSGAPPRDLPSPADAGFLASLPSATSVHQPG